MNPLFFCRAGRLVALVAGLLVTAAPVRAAEPVFVPTFVDPHLPIDRPNLGERRTLRLLTTDDYPPFSFRGPDGTLAGYNVDLARALCATLAVTCTIEARPLEGLVPALQAGGADAALGSLRITERSRAAVDFSSPTMRLPARFAGRRGAVPAVVLPETVGRLVIGAQAGTAHEAFLRDLFPRAVVRSFPDPDSLRAALRTGRVDLLFADGLATALWLGGTEAAGCCALAGGPFLESRYFGEGTGVAVRKGDTVLRQAFDWALQRLAANGTDADLYLKYFPLGFF